MTKIIFNRREVLFECFNCHKKTVLEDPIAWRNQFEYWFGINYKVNNNEIQKIPIKYGTTTKYYKALRTGTYHCHTCRSKSKSKL